MSIESQWIGAKDAPTGYYATTATLRSPQQPERPQTERPQTLVESLVQQAKQNTLNLYALESRIQILHDRLFGANPPSESKDAKDIEPTGVLYEVSQQQQYTQASITRIGEKLLAIENYVGL